MEKLPYLPIGKTIKYASSTHEFMQAAQTVARTQSLDPDHPTGAVVVAQGKVIGQGANGSKFHKIPGCTRKKLKIPTGKKYWLCPGCSPSNHAEQRAIKKALDHHNTVKGADIYLWGHWWCCESCWFNMIQAGINDVYLLEDAQSAFKK